MNDSLCERLAIKPPKLPFVIWMKDDPPFVFAGLWEGWKDPSTDEWLRTCTIITDEPNELVAEVHIRTPVILPEEHNAKWLGQARDGDFKELLKPLLPEEMKMWPISPRHLPSRSPQ